MTPTVRTERANNRPGNVNLQFELSIRPLHSKITVSLLPGNVSDGPCSRWDSKENGIKNAIFMGHYYSSGDLEKTLKSFTPVTIFTVQDDLFKYRYNRDSGGGGLQIPSSAANKSILLTPF